MGDNRSLPFYNRAYEHYKEESARLKKVEQLRGRKELTEIEEYRDPLSIEEKKEVTILLLSGGPSDGYKLFVDKDGEVLKGFYFFADWFEYGEIKLRDEELDQVLSVYPIDYL